MSWLLMQQAWYSHQYGAKTTFCLYFWNQLVPVVMVQSPQQCSGTTWPGVCVYTAGNVKASYQMCLLRSVSLCLCVVVVNGVLICSFHSSKTFSSATLAQYYIGGCGHRGMHDMCVCWPIGHTAVRTCVLTYRTHATVHAVSMGCMFSTWWGAHCILLWGSYFVIVIVMVQVSIRLCDLFPQPCAGQGSSLPW